MTRNGDENVIRDFAYSDSAIGKRINPRVVTIPHKPGELAKRYKAKGTDPDLGVARPEEEERRYNGRKKILEDAAREMSNT